MDRRITLQRVTHADDGFSSHGQETWSDLMTVWAEFESVSDSERMRAGGIEASSMARFRIRYSATAAGLGPEDRVLFDGREWEVVGIPKEIGRRRGLEITARAPA